MRRRRFFFILFLLLTAYVGGQLWDIHRVGYLEQDRHADCAIVLGAAAWHDKPSPVLRERLNHAIDLYKSGHAKALLLTGGFGEGADFAESKVGMDYCVDHGVPRDKIRVEIESMSTVANLRKAKEIMEKEDWNSALLVSDPWHLKRARRMATDLDLTVYPSATPSSRFVSTGAKAEFLFKEFYLYHSYLITGK